MAKSDEWELPEPLRPQQGRFNFDLAAIYRSVVLVHTEASEDGYTAPFLGTERLGSGVVIRSAERKLVLTIGYLITEAESIWLTTSTARWSRPAPGVRPGQRLRAGAAAGPARRPGDRARLGATLALGDNVSWSGQGGERIRWKRS
jgi:hypothetical protein